jgi:hypothetical protein
VKVLEKYGFTVPQATGEHPGETWPSFRKRNGRQGLSILPKRYMRKGIWRLAGNISPIKSKGKRNVILSQLRGFLQWSSFITAGRTAPTPQTVAEE